MPGPTDPAQCRRAGYLHLVAKGAPWQTAEGTDQHWHLAGVTPAATHPLGFWPVLPVIEAGTNKQILIRLIGIIGQPGELTANAVGDHKNRQLGDILLRPLQGTGGIEPAPLGDRDPRILHIAG